MKAIYFGIKFHQDRRNKQYIEALSSAIEAAGWKTSCIARDIECWGDVELSPQELMSRTFQEIDASDVVVIELSEKGVGLGIEAGYAYARGKSVVTIAKKGSDISVTLRGISKDVLVFEDMSEVTTFFSDLADL